MAEFNDHAARAHALLSASSASRWMACPPSAMLAARYPKTDTPFTLEGTLAHEVAEAVASGKAVPELDGDMQREMIRHAEGYRDYISGLCESTSEVLLEQRVDFSPWVPSGFGTADCIVLTGDHMDVIDYKYGQGVAVSADHNPQMMLYGLGAMNEYGFVYSVKTVNLHIYQPRLDSISVCELTAVDLLAFGDEVRKVAKKAAKGAGKLNAGDHCRFCPHSGKCPELAFRCLSAVSVGNEIAPSLDTLAPQTVSTILSLEPMISMWLRKVKERALVDLMAGESIPGYKVVEGKLGNRKWTDELAVAAALDAAGVAREDYTTLQLLSPSAMDKALGKKRAAELLADYVDRAPGAPTVVPEADKRPKLDRVAQAQDDYK